MIFTGISFFFMPFNIIFSTDFWEKRNTTPYTDCLPGTRIHYWKITPNIFSERTFCGVSTARGGSRSHEAVLHVSAMPAAGAHQAKRELGCWIKQIMASFHDAKKQIASSENFLPTTRNHLRLPTRALRGGQGRIMAHNDLEQFPTLPMLNMVVGYYRPVSHSSFSI